MYTSNPSFKRKSLLFFAPLLFIFTLSPLNAATIIFNKDFESGGLSGLKCSGNCPTITASPVANGKYSGNFTLTRNMPTSYRTEAVLTKNGFFDYGKEYWIGFDYRYKDWKKDSDADFAPFQIHTRSSDYSKECQITPAYSTAPFFMVTHNGEARFVTYPGKILWRAPLQSNQWLNIIVRFRISTGSDGFIEVWKDGVKLGRVDGANGPKFDLCGKPMRTPYLKMGVYKWTWKNDAKTTEASRRQLFIDNFRIAEGSNGASLVGSGSTPSGTVDPTPPTPHNTTNTTNTNSQHSSRRRNVSSALDNGEWNRYIHARYIR